MKHLSRRQLMRSLGVVSSGMALRSAGAQSRAMNVKLGANFVEIENGLVKARFNKRSGGIEQAYFAKNSAGGWVPVVSAFRPPQPRPDGTAPLYSDKNVATDYRLLVANGTSQTEVAENKSTLI